MAASEPPRRQRSFLWRVTHPREARCQREKEKDKKRKAEEDRQGRQAVEKALIKRQKEAEWLRIVCDPRTSHKELLGTVADEAASWYELSRGQNYAEEHAIENHWRPWKYDFLRAVAAHPNFSLESLGTELKITRCTVEGVLRNPTLPLVLLASPDFLDKLNLGDDRHTHVMPGNRGIGETYFNKTHLFAQYALQHADIPAALLFPIANINEPWFALEAKTHIAAEGFADVPPTPDLEWLDTQIINLLRSDTQLRRCLVYELACYGLLPKNIEPEAPWEPTDVREREQAAANPEVRELVPLTREMTWRSPRNREEYLVWHCLDRAAFWNDVRIGIQCTEAVLTHPEAAPWVRYSVVKRWPRNPRLEDICSVYRMMTLRLGEPSEKAIASYRARAIEDGLGAWNWPYEWERSSPGILYLMGRDLPDLLSGKTLEPQYKIPDSGYLSYSAPVQTQHFLVRLLIALRLDDAEQEHRTWRGILQNDPNSYVRAVARKELTR